MNASSPLASLLPKLERIVGRLGAGDIPAALGELERLKAVAWARLADARERGEGGVRDVAGGAHVGAEDRLLRPDEAAEVLRVPVRWVYRHGPKLPGFRRLSRRCVRFSEAKLRRWISEGSA